MNLNLKKLLKQEASRKRKYKCDEDETDTDEPDTKKLKSSANPLNDILTLMSGQEERIYRIDNHIYYTGRVDMSGINTLRKLINEVNQLNNEVKTFVKCATVTPKPIFLHITSMGGDLLAGFTAIDIMNASKIPVYTVCEGYAISSGSLMFVSGKKRYMTKHSYQLIHQLSSGLNGKYEEMQDDMANSDKMMKKIVEIYFKASDGKMTKAAIKKALTHDLLFDYEECKNLGLTDAVYDPLNSRDE